MDSPLESHPSESHQRRRSPPPPEHPLHIEETAVDLDPVVINMPSATTPSPGEPIATMAHMSGGETHVMGAASAPSPSSSESSSNGFVKVEHGDVQHSSTMSTPTEHLLQQHIDSLEGRTDHANGSAMDHSSGLEESQSGILPRAPDFVESSLEKMTDVVSTGAEKIAQEAGHAYSVAADMANEALHSARDATEAAAATLGETIHLVDDKVEGAVKEAGDRAHDVYEGVVDGSRDLRESAAEKLSGVSHEITGTAEAARDSVAEAAHKAMDTITGEVADAKHTIADMAHHAGDTIGEKVEETKEVAKEAADAAAGAVHSAEETFDDLGHKLKEAAEHRAGDLLSGSEVHEAARTREENLIGLSDDTGADAATKPMFGAKTEIELDKPTGALPAAAEAELRDSGWEHYGKATEGAAEDTIRSGIADIHDQVDSMIEKMHAVGVPQHDPGSTEENTYDRRGPLTIPQQMSGDAGGNEHDEDVLESSRHSGFEVSPRPPTPPKALDDEDVKPTTIDVGQPAYKPSSVGEHPRSILKHSGQECKFNLKWVNPEVLDLLYWRDPKKSGAVLGVTVLALLVFAKFSLVAVLSYLGLAILGGTLGFRLYKLVEAQIKKTDGGNPFQPYLNREFHIPQDKVHQQVDVLIEHAQLIGNELRRLFLVENILDSVKFGLLLWALTYVSCWFSGLSLLILFVLAVFTIPKVYEVYQEPIDRNVAVAKQHVENVTKKVNDKVPPFLKKSIAAGDAGHEKSN